MWGKYAAVVRNNYGKGKVTYVGFMPSNALIERIMEHCVKRAGLWGEQQALHFPTIMRSGVLTNGHPVHYLLNYSSAPLRAAYSFPAGKNLLSDDAVPQDGTVALPAWGVAVIEEGAR